MFAIRLMKEHRPDLQANIASLKAGPSDRRLLAIVDHGRLASILEKMLDSDEFLSSFGIRGLSKFHEKSPYVFHLGTEHRVDYEPGESSTALFGGNSNWRG
jgi:hypothetical protein